MPAASGRPVRRILSAGGHGPAHHTHRSASWQPHLSRPGSGIFPAGSSSILRRPRRIRRSAAWSSPARSTARFVNMAGSAYLIRRACGHSFASARGPIVAGSRGLPSSILMWWARRQGEPGSRSSPVQHIREPVWSGAGLVCFSLRLPLPASQVSFAGAPPWLQSLLSGFPPLRRLTPGASWLLLYVTLEVRCRYWVSRGSCWPSGLSSSQVKMVRAFWNCAWFLACTWQYPVAWCSAAFSWALLMLFSSLLQELEFQTGRGYVS